MGVHIRAAGNVLTVLVVGIGLFAAMVWLVNGKLPSARLVAAAAAAYGLGVLSHRLITRKMKGLKSKYDKKLNGDGRPV